MPELSDLIYHYSVKIAELEHRLPKLSQKQLDKIINEEFQFSSAELAVIEEEFVYLLEAGYNFLREENYDRSAEYFREAIKLQPLNVKVLKGLGASNLALFVETGDLAYKNSLELICERIITVQPSNSDAARVITAIENYHKIKKGLMVKASIIGGITVLMALIAFFSSAPLLFCIPMLPGIYFGINTVKGFLGFRRSVFEGISIS